MTIIVYIHLDVRIGFFSVIMLIWRIQYAYFDYFLRIYIFSVVFSDFQFGAVEYEGRNHLYSLSIFFSVPLLCRINHTSHVSLSRKKV